jgi:hypothetical protein
VQDEESQRFALEQVLDAGALLMGRTTYEIWAAFWPSAPGGDEAFTRRMNEIPKYVVRLVGTRPFKSGIVLLTYQPELAVPQSSYLAFTPLGSVGLRGVPGQWELFGAEVA